MLAQLFDKPALADSSYAPVVWEFLNEVAPTDEDHISRKARLIKTWITLKRMNSPDTAAGKSKIDRVTSQPSAQTRLTIDDLEDRAAMLGDVRAKNSFFKTRPGRTFDELTKPHTPVKNLKLGPA